MSFTSYQGICLANYTALATWTGATGDTSIQTHTVKGGTVGPNDRLEFILISDMSTTSQTQSIKMGASTILSLTTSASISLIRKGNIHFRNSVASQVVMPPGSQSDIQGSTSALSTYSEDFASDVLFDVRSNLTVISQTFNLRVFSLILWKAPA